MSRRVMPERVDPGDAGRHLVDEALHPQAGQAQVVGATAVARPSTRAVAPRSAVGARRRPPTACQDLVAQADELGPLLGERRQDLVELGHGGVRVVDVVEAGHRARF